MNPETGTIIRSGISVVTNLPDRHALEEALRIKEQCGGSVTVLTMGPPQARKCLEEALATGADRGVLLCDPSFAGSDTLATARVLAAGIPKLFISIGASGAVHYTTGFQKSRIIVAIDKNPKAFIFSIADLGIVGDLKRIVPALIEELRNKKSL